MTQKKDDIRFDQRLVAYHLRTGALDPREYETHLTTLPDSSASADYVALVHEPLEKTKRTVIHPHGAGLAFTAAEGESSEA